MDAVRVATFAQLKFQRSDMEVRIVAWIEAVRGLESAVRFGESNHGLNVGLDVFLEDQGLIVAMPLGVSLISSGLIEKRVLRAIWLCRMVVGVGGGASSRLRLATNWRTPLLRLPDRVECFVATIVTLGGVAGLVVASAGGLVAASVGELVMPAGVVTCVVAGSGLDGVKVGRPPFGSEESSSVPLWYSYRAV